MTKTQIFFLVLAALIAGFLIAKITKRFGNTTSKLIGTGTKIGVATATITLGTSTSTNSSTSTGTTIPSQKYGGVISKCNPLSPMTITGNCGKPSIQSEGCNYKNTNRKAGAVNLCLFVRQ